MANNKKRIGWTWLNLLISIAVLVLVIIIFVKKEKKEGYGCYAPSKDKRGYGCCPEGEHKCDGNSTHCCKNIPCKEMFELKCNCPKDCDECKLYTYG